MQKGKNMKKRLKIVYIVPCLWLLFGILWLVWYHVVKGQLMLDSDMSSEMILSDILNKEHSVLSKNWIYSTELRFLNTQWLYRAGLLLFPWNWHLARIFSMFLGILLLAFAAWLCFYAAGRPLAGIWAAAFTIFPGGSWYFWQTLYGGHYLPYILISLFSFAMILISCSRPVLSVKGIVMLLSIVMLGLASGLNGIKQLMVFYAPLTISAAAAFLYELHRAALSKEKESIFGLKGFRFLILSLLATVFSFAGYLINTGYLSGLYYFQSFDEQRISQGSFIDFLKQFILCYGFADDKLLVSGQGIAAMCGVTFGLLVILSGIRLLFRYKRLGFEERIVAAVSLFSIIFCAFIFSYVGGEIQYFQPVLPFGIFLVVLELETEEFAMKKSSFAALNIAGIVLLAASLGTVYNEEHEPFHNYRAQPQLNTVVKWLCAQGYEDGVSLFWTSNIVTDLSDGQIDMWTLNPMDEDISWYRWLQRYDHMDSFPQGRYFFLFCNNEAESEPVNFLFLQKHPELVPIYQDDFYTVYGD